MKKVEKELIADGTATQSHVKKKIEQLKIINSQAKEAHVDHLNMTTSREIISPSKTFRLSRKASDQNMAIIVYWEANQIRTSLNAVLRLVSLQKNCSLSVNFFQTLQSSLINDEFLAILFTYHDQDIAKTEAILTSYIHAAYYTYSRDIPEWLKQNGIPESISLPIFELVVNIERTIYNINAIQSDQNRIRNQSDAANEDKYSITFVKNFKKRITDLILQKNTLQTWVNTVSIHKKDKKTYERFINTKLSSLTSMLDSLYTDIDPSIQNLLKACTKNNGNINFITDLNDIICKNKKFLPSITAQILKTLKQNTFATPAVVNLPQNALCKALDEVATKYKLNSPHNTIM